MLETMDQMFYMINTQENNYIVLAVFLGICVFTIFLRIITCIGYQTNFTFCKMNMKEYKSIADVKNVKPPLLNKVIKDYIKSAEKNISSVNTKAIVNKHLLQLHFMGWSYSGIEHFVAGFEQAMMMIGVLLVFVFSDFQFLYCFVTLAAFVVLRVLASIFDFRLVREKLLEELTEYVDREIGQYFAGDYGSIILRLKNDLTTAVRQQSDAIAESVRTMGNDLSGLMRLSMQEMTGHVEESADRISSYADVLKKPLESWNETLTAADGLQSRINQSVVSMEAASMRLNAASDGLSESLKAHGEAIGRQAETARSQIEQLVQLSAGIKDCYRMTEKSNEAVARQLTFIERNQSLLDTGIQQYEASLENITKNIGDGFGSIVEFHIQSSYNTVNENLQSNLSKIIYANNELIERLRQLFDTMLEQSRSETQAIVKIKEQMDIHFESLSGRML